MSVAFDLLAERRIREAIERGELDDLPGAGCPLDLTEDPLIPEDLRVAYRMLKTAGYVPPQIESLRELRALERLIESAPEAETRRQAALKLDLLRARLEAERTRATRSLHEYRPVRLARLQRRG